ncbi:unnamed protein product [Closterium sp. NIES-53]
MLSNRWGGGFQGIGRVRTGGTGVSGREEGANSWNGSPAAAATAHVVTATAPASASTALLLSLQPLLSSLQPLLSSLQPCYCRFSPAAAATSPAVVATALASADTALLLPLLPLLSPLQPLLTILQRCYYRLSPAAATTAMLSLLQPLPLPLLPLLTPLKALLAPLQPYELHAALAARALQPALPIHVPACAALPVCFHCSSLYTRHSTCHYNSYQHTWGSLQPPTTPTQPAADAGKEVQWQGDRLAYTQWTERNAVAQLAVRAHLPVNQRARFCQVTPAQTFCDTIVRHYSLSPAIRPLRQSRLLLGEVQQLVEEAIVGTCTSTRTGGVASRGEGFGSGQQRQPDTLSPQQLGEWVSQRRVHGGVEATSLGAYKPASTGAVPAEALHTFTLDSCASRCFFRDCTTVTPLTTPVPITLADPYGGPVVARASTVLL